MLPIVDKPTLQYIIEECVESGIEEIIIITGRNKKSIEDHFDKSVELELELARTGKDDLLTMVHNISNMANIYYIRQKEPKGLGHAIYCARAFIGNEPFAVLLGDDVVYSDDKPCIKQLIDCFDKYNKTILGVQKVPANEVFKYGIISGKKIDKEVYMVNDMVEKPDINRSPSNMAILGRYIITPEIFNILQNTKPGKGGEIQLTDALSILREKEGLYAYNFIGERYDIGDKLGFLQATVEYALRNPELKEGFLKFLLSINK